MPLVTVRQARPVAGMADASSAILRLAGAHSCYHISGGKTHDQGQSQDYDSRHADFPEEQLEGDNLGVLHDDYQNQNRQDEDDDGLDVHEEASQMS
jgi:hypothetical protein